MLRYSRNSLLDIGFFAIALIAAYAVAQYIRSDAIFDLLYIGMIILGAVVFVVILEDWRRGVYLFLTWLLFEDLVRKYLGNNMAVYFAKDALAIILYISFFRTMRAKRIERFKIPFLVPLLLFFWLCLIQVFNPASPSVWYGILGLRIYFLYVPLIYIGYTFIDSEDDLQGLFSFVSFLILVVAGLGIVQSIIGPSFLNPEHLQEDIRELSTLYRSSSSGLAYRPTSVFVSAGRLQDFLVVAWIVSLGHTSYLMLRHRRGRMLAFTALAVVAGASLMSTSRGVFMWNVGIALLFAVGFLWGAPWRQSEAIRVLRTTFRVIFFSGSAIVLLIVLFPGAVRSRLEIYYNTLMPTSPNSELVLRTHTYPMQQLGRAFDSSRWVYGNGTGTSSLGLQYVSRIMGAPPTPGGGGETGFGNLVVELGVLGLGLWIVLGLAIIISAWKVVTKLRGTPWLPLVLAILVYAIVLCFPMTYSGFSYQDFLMNAFFWLLLGMLYRLKLFPKAFQIAHPEGGSGRG